MIKITLLDYSESKSVVEFYNSFYPDKGRDEMKFKWEFQNSPYQESIYVIAKDSENGKIVGSQAAIPLEIIDGNGNVTLTAKSEDTLVHPDYRGQNIFENMYKLLLEECTNRGIKVVWGITPAKKPFEKIGFDLPYSFSQSFAVFNAVKSIRYLNKCNPSKLKNTLVRTGFCILSWIKSIRFKIGFINLKNIDYSISYSDAMDNSKLITHVLSNDKRQFYIKQDKKYMAWRITENPYYSKVVCLHFKKSEREVATLLFNHHKDGAWFLIQDIFSNDLSVKEKIDIIKKSIRILNQSESVTIIRTWDFVHNPINKQNVEHKNKAGFLHANIGSRFVWKVLDSNISLKPTDFILSRIASEGTT